MSQRRAGLIQVALNGEILEAKGNWSYNPGKPLRRAIIGADGVHGFAEEPQVAFIEGEITDRGSLDLAALAATEDATVTLSMVSGKMFMLREAWFAGEGTGTTEEAAIAIRFEGASGEEIA